jgi:glucose/arabinose dehydrogenase
LDLHKNKSTEAALHALRFSKLLRHVPLLLAASFASAQTADPTSGNVSAADWRADAPGVKRLIKPSDLQPNPTATDPEGSVGKPVKVVKPAAGAMPKVPDGFTVQVFASGLDKPRTMRVAPNGDVFVSETGSGRVLVFKGSAGAAPGQPEVFADGLERPYGIAFVPPSKPKYVYVAASNKVVRYPYSSGAVKAGGPAETIVDNIPTKRHWTRDLAVTRDGKRLFLAVGSGSNLAGGMPDMAPEKLRQQDKTHGRGSAWGEELNRGVVRVFDAQGKGLRNYATGLRNCSGLAMQPRTDNLWCVVNERDHLGPLLVPDFMARVQDGAFYGWPWYYIGGNEDPALKGKRPDLKSHVKVPEVLIQAHSSALSAVFYDSDAFPAEYRGDAFVALHGSHSRPDRTGYKVIRVRMKGGVPTGEYEDFVTGFLVDNDNAWGRPAGVAVTRDGALLVSEDGNGTIFRVSRK